jgi:hypothetical protein
MSQESQQNKEQCECVRNGEREEYRNGKCWICYGKEIKEQHVKDLRKKGKVIVPL